MTYVDVFSNWYFDNHPSESIVKIIIVISWWLNGMHKCNGFILEDSCSIIDTIFHMCDEEMGEIVDGCHQSSNWIMEELVVRESLVGSVIIKIGNGNIIDR